MSALDSVLCALDDLGDRSRARAQIYCSARTFYEIGKHYHSTRLRVLAERLGVRSIMTAPHITDREFFIIIPCGLSRRD